MKLDLIYDRETDAAYLRFSSEKIVESSQITPSLVIDFDAKGQMVAIEFLNARSILPSETLVAAE